MHHYTFYIDNILNKIVELFIRLPLLLVITKERGLEKVVSICSGKGLHGHSNSDPQAPCINLNCLWLMNKSISNEASHSGVRLYTFIQDKVVLT